MLLTGKNAVITGANRGIGKAIVEAFAREGANIWACSRKETSHFAHFTEALSSECGVRVRPVYFDMTDGQAIKTAVREIIAEKQPVDILVNNAGVAIGGFFQMTPISSIREVFEVNYFAQLEITQAISRLMCRQKSGSIINMASVSGIDVEAGNCAYGASKAALIAFTVSLAAELASSGVRVNAIAPGLTDTDMAGQMEAKAMTRMIERSFMNRLCRPCEVADTAVFLASEMSAFITGQVIRVDGGMI